MVAVEVVEREGVDALASSGEVGVDLEALEVADDEEGRVAEVFAVVVELLIGLFEGLVLAFAFVFPGKVVAQPNVGKAGAAARFADLFLEGVALAGWVGLGRGLLAEELAKVVEMGLRAGPLRLRVDLPAVYEVGDGRRHGARVVYSDGAGGLCGIWRWMLPAVVRGAKDRGTKNQSGNCECQD